MQEKATAGAESYDRPSIEVEQSSSSASEHGEDARSRKRTASVSPDQRPAKVLKSSDGSKESRESSVLTASDASGKKEKTIEELEAELESLRQAKENNVRLYHQKLNKITDENTELQSEKADLQLEVAKLKKSKTEASKEKVGQVTANLNEKHEAEVKDMRARFNKKVRELKDEKAAAEEEAKDAKAELAQREKEIKKEKLDFKRELKQEQQAEIKKYRPETSTELKEKKKAIDEHVKREKAYEEQIKKSGEEIGELRAKLESRSKRNQQACQSIKGLQDIVKQKEDFINEMGRGYNEKLKFEGDRWAKLQECHAETKVMLTAQQRANFNLRNGMDSLSVKYAKLLAEVARLKGAPAAPGQGSAGGDVRAERAGKEKDEKGREASEDDASTGVAGIEKQDGSQTSSSSTPQDVKQTQAPSSIFDGKTSPSTEKADTPVSEQASNSMEENDEVEVVQPSTSSEQAEVDTTPSSEEKADTPVSEASAPNNYQDGTASREEVGSSEAMDVDGDSKDQKQVFASTSQQGDAGSDAGGKGEDVESGRPIWARLNVGLRENMQFQAAGWSAPSERSESVREGSDDMGMQG